MQGILLLLALINSVLFFFNIKKGMIMYLILIFTAPHIKIIGNVLSYELVLFIPLVFSVLYHILKSKIIKVNSNIVILVVILILILISSLVSMIKHDVYRLNIAQIVFYLRMIFITYILNEYELFKPKDFLFAFKVIILVNFLTALIQIVYPESINVFYDLYFKPTLTSLREFKNLGRFTRAAGTMGSPVYLGYLSVLSMSIFYTYYKIHGSNKSNTFFTIISIISGMFSLSKTALFGIPIIFVLINLISIIYSRKYKINVKKLVGVLLIMIFFPIIFSKVNTYLINNNFPVEYYYRFFKNPIEAFSTRYDENEGLLTKSFEISRDNIVIGVGATTPENEFIGDSMYYVLLHDMGIIGLTVVLLYYIYIVRKLIKYKLYFLITIIITILIGGLSVPSTSMTITWIIVSYISTSINQVTREEL